MDIILGSSSPFRAQVLREAGFTFTVIRPDIDEKLISKGILSPNTLVLKLAHAKAEAILQRRPPAGFLITSDQVVVSDGQILEKPSSPTEARARLVDYWQNPPMTYTAVVVTNTKTRAQAVAVDRACVLFRQISKKAIDGALRRGTIMDCCGAFDIDDPDLKPFIEAINGDRTSVLGMPIATVKLLLGALDYKF
ncbi:Maf family protein [Candidatus Uhrbacteria bacterium]|nr:Maf family protein [Candidatus Uhrbacteria bacterium]